MVGTVTSRVSRARDRLAAILYEGLPAGERMAAETAYPHLMAQIDTLGAGVEQRGQIIVQSRRGRPQQRPEVEQNHPQGGHDAKPGQRLDLPGSHT